MDTTIVNHEDGTFTEYDADGNEIGYGDWRDLPCEHGIPYHCDCAICSPETVAAHGRALDRMWREVIAEGSSFWTY